MKVVITGHTKGIGKSIFDLLSDKGYDVVGLSRSNGFDISETQKVVEEIISIDPEIFINNAYQPKVQTEILKKVYSNWKSKTKMIINMCSVAALIPSDHEDYHMEYASDKREQKKFCEKVNFNYSKKDFVSTRCKLTNLNFDYVKTDFKSKHDKRKFPNLLPKEVADLVLFVILNKEVCFREISLHSTRIPEMVQ
tara:strand:+ start:124 stop:708 length:585 start_codon:yes stop_codon:yes gene_type:complete